MPAENPKANIAILTGEVMLPHKVTDEATAISKKSSAVATSARFDFIFDFP